LVTVMSWSPASVSRGTVTRSTTSSGLTVVTLTTSMLEPSKRTAKSRPSTKSSPSTTSRTSCCPASSTAGCTAWMLGAGICGEMS